MLPIYVLIIIVQFSNADGNFIRVDCHPDVNANKERCESRGCTWTPSSVPNEPFCHFSTENFAGYSVQSVSDDKSSHKLKLTLKRLKTPTIFGYDHDTVILTIDQINSNEIRIKFSPTKLPKKKTSYMSKIEDRFRIKLKHRFSSSNPQYDIQTKMNPFGIKLLRRSTNQTIFDTTDIPGLTFEDQFMSITTKTASDNIYGFGEQVHSSLKHNMRLWRKWGMFARDEPSGGSDLNLYGVHPFYLCIENDGNAHGVFLNNVHAQSVELSPNPSITYRTIGGLLDFFIFLGPTPADVIQQYQSLIGFPHMPPYWALGFHLCRFGYQNSTVAQKVWKRNKKAGIPLDAQWLDIDYMSQKMDFTFDAKKFESLPSFVEALHNNNNKVVLIQDPAIASRPKTSYAPLTDGLESNVFILDDRTKQPIEGSVWPGKTFFPDFTNPNTTKWWTKQATKFYQDIKFDGLWIDMNEPSSFDCGSTTGCSTNKWNNPPFVPLQDQNILTKTICMDSLQYEGLHYDLHSLFGYYESVATRKTMLTLFPTQRPFILSRSTAAGSGVHVAHWTGDNTSDWPDLKWSIISSLEFNFFGLPFVGADICGFNGAANEELCTRWMQLGAFYPFSRNHNSIGQPDQDPAVWSASAINSSRNVLTIRYKLLPYLYTLMQHAHSNGSTVMRPLFFEFPNDPNTFDIDDQFLWGSGLMIVPILTASSVSRTVYFPKGRWFQYDNGCEVKNSEQGKSQTYSISKYEIGLFVKGGVIIPWQEPSQTTTQSRLHPFGLLVALDEKQVATGDLYWDDGITLDADIDGRYTKFLFSVVSANNYSGILTVSRPYGKYYEVRKLNTICIFGLLAKPASVKVNGHLIQLDQIDFDVMTKKTTFKSLEIDFFYVETPIHIQWSLQIS